MEADLPSRPLIGLLLRLLYQHYSQDIDAALRDAGFDDIRPPHANVFPFVPPDVITVSGLAELARVRKQTMAEAVNDLERLGYVERRPNPNGRRSRLVFLTELSDDQGLDEDRTELPPISTDIVGIVYCPAPQASTSN